MPASTTAIQLSDAEIQSWLRLSLTPSIGNAAARRLLTQCGSPEAIFSAQMGELQACVSTAQAQQLAQAPASLASTMERTLRWLGASDDKVVHTMIALGDPRYPEGLLQTADPPLLLYAAGNREHLVHGYPWQAWEHTLAIVGSRNPTPQGAQHAHQFGREMASQGWCIASGLALGIDAQAHEGALQGAQQWPATIAVVGTGLDVVYPRSHAKLSQMIREQGVLLSEFPLGTPPLAANFPKRNRIISGLSRGCLVVEAALASGSLITARMASEQGREVFAIPGSIHNPQSKGCHALIRQGAKLVETAADIVEEFAQSLPSRPRQSSGAEAVQAAVTDVRPIATPLLQAMGHDPMDLDTLMACTGWALPELQVQLLEHELNGTVERLPGGWFQRSFRA